MNEYLENHSPSEWLTHLMQAADGYAVLLEHSGSLARAAHRLARARCRTHAIPMNLPTVRELGAAAAELCRFLQHERPSPAVLAKECEQLGLGVILPMTRSAA